MLHTFFIHLRQIIKSQKMLMNQSQKLLISQSQKLMSRASILVKSDIIAESDSEVIDETKLESEVKVSYWDSCRSSSGAHHGAIFDSYIFKIAWYLWPVADLLQETGSTKIGGLVCELIFSRVELPSYTACILVEQPPTSAGMPRKSVPPPSPWFC